MRRQIRKMSHVDAFGETGTIMLLTMCAVIFVLLVGIPFTNYAWNRYSNESTIWRGKAIAHKELCVDKEYETADATEEMNEKCRPLTERTRFWPIVNTMFLILSDWSEYIGDIFEFLNMIRNPFANFGIFLIILIFILMVVWRCFFNVSAPPVYIHSQPAPIQQPQIMQQPNQPQYLVVGGMGQYGQYPSPHMHVGSTDESSLVYGGVSHESQAVRRRRHQASIDDLLGHNPSAAGV